MTHHARKRIRERHIREVDIMEIVEGSTVRAKDDRRIWIYREFPNRQDNLLSVAALLDDVIIIKTVMTFGGIPMKTDYHATDDILVLHFSDKPVAREVSQDWNLNISYADDGCIVEIVILDAKASGAWPTPQHAA
nr:DUF2283 domain-containing protein [Acidithiobacillus ferrooxidans]